MSDIKRQKVAGSFSRLWQIRRIVRKYQLTEVVNDFDLPKPAKLFLAAALGRSAPSREDRPQRIRAALEELGPVFVKLGQALSTRPDLLPDDVALELAKLQDKVPPFSPATSLKIIKQAYGDQLDSVFESIDEQPLASASVAQVHAATLQPGISVPGQNGTSTNEVVIKVLRPGIKRIIESDLKVMYRAASFLQKYWSRGKQFRPLDVIKEYDLTIHDELDLRTEAANAARMGANFEDSDLIYVPRIYWDFTSENVLVMERINGISIREIESFKEQGIDLKALAEDGVAVFFKQAFEDNFFHADMHAGNIFVSNEGKWISIDFGIMGTLDIQDQRYLGEMLLGFFNRDYASIADAHIRAGWVPEGTKAAEFEQAIRVVCEPIFAKPLSQISFGNVLMHLFQTVRRFEMPVQPQLVLLYKTLLNIEGLGRQLYPDLNLWDTAKPFLEDWMKKQMSPQKLFDDIKRNFPQWQSALQSLPQAIEKSAQTAINREQNPKSMSHWERLASSLVCISIFGTLSVQLEIIEFDKLNLFLPSIGVIGILILVGKRT